MTTEQKPPKFWFISDLHVGHNNVLKHCNRPFLGMPQQTEVFRDSWNLRVAPGDIVFVLGDFSFYDSDTTGRILRSLNGQKTLIRGNHDHSNTLAKTVGWNRVLHYHEQMIDGDRVCLFHFPILSWHQIHRGAYHLHGHCHGSMNYPGDLGNARIMDVGVDNIAKLTGEYRPMEWSEIKELLSKRKYAHSDDHHQLRGTHVHIQD